MPSQIDHDLLKDFFPNPAYRKPKKNRTKHEYIAANGDRLYVEKCGSQWEGIVNDDHSCIYIASTKKELLSDMGYNA